MNKYSYQKKYLEKYPWVKNLNGLRMRCNNKNNPKYDRYGGHGIKALITREEIKRLWFRDKAYELKRPSLDRIDNDGNYEYKNCRFVELGFNAIRNNSKEGTHCYKGHKYTKENTRIYIRKTKNNSVYRICLICRNEYQKEWARKKRLKERNDNKE